MREKQINVGISFIDFTQAIFLRIGNHLLLKNSHYLEREIPEL
jgi:hypothetical protein